jgi:mannose-1-phosphate guanylyltransferase
MGGTTTVSRWGLVLAGGDGTRLQALTEAISGRPIPKQYCRILGDRSLLEATLARVAPYVSPAHTLVIVNDDHLGLAAEQLRALPAANVVVQPRNRETGPGMLLSLLALAARAPDATVAVFPSDHYVHDDAAFRVELERATDVVDMLPDKIVLLGIRPDAPEPELGYIEPAGAAGVGAFHVAAFHEKPTPEHAMHLVGAGGLWNSFVMVFRLPRMLALLAAMRPADVAAMAARCADPVALAAHYDTLAGWNFSRDFLAAVPEHLVTVRVDGVGWSDWGTREAIERTLAGLKRQPPWQLASRSAAA